jgi:aerotolerance regulator-like protein/VWA domain-containing protein
MFGLSFLSPLFLVGAAAAAIPIAIHLFYRRAEPVVDFAAMRYLRRAPVEQARRRRLRELVLLALRVTALVLLACAFARPYVSESVAALNSGATMVLIDTSASLSAPGRFDAARERAERVIREAPPTHAVGVVAFAHASEEIAPLSQDRAGALAAVAQLKPGAGATRYRAALRRAGEAFNGRSGRLVVITDLQQSGWDAASEGGIPDTIAVEVEDIGGPSANVAITSLRAEGTEAVAVVHNFSPRPATEQVVFTVDDRRIGAVPLALAPGGSAEARVPVDGYRTGALSASITDREGYLADNVRYAVLDAANAISVLAVTATGHPSEALYLERALAIAEGTGGFRFRALSGAAFSQPDTDALGDVDVLAIVSTRGVEQRGRERLAQFVRSGGGLLLTAGPDVEPELLRQALGGIVATSWSARPGQALPQASGQTSGQASGETLSFAPDDSRHPVFRLFGGAGTLGNVSFARAARIEAPASANVIARYSDGSPALVDERTTGGRVLVFGSDLNYRWNDFPLQPAFVPFIHEALRYLATPRTTRSDFLVGDLQAVSAATAGIVDLQGRRVAVNTDPRESDPARMLAETFQAGISRLNATAAQQARSEARQQEDSQGLWWYGLLLMVVSLAAEGVLGRRLG